MPAYHYQCVHCQVQEIRIGGVDDHCARCMDCGHLMLRLDLDFFRPYFAARPPDMIPVLDQTGENV